MMADNRAVNGSGYGPKILIGHGPKNSGTFPSTIFQPQVVPSTIYLFVLSVFLFGVVPSRPPLFIYLLFICFISFFIWSSPLHYLFIGAISYVPLKNSLFSYLPLLEGYY